jgi:hypothetical protein
LGSARLGSQKGGLWARRAKAIDPFKAAGARFYLIGVYLIRSRRAA